MALDLPDESAVIDSEVDEISFPNSSITLTARDVAFEAGSPVAWNVTSTSSPSTKVLLLARFVSALKLWGTLDAGLLVPDELALGGVTGALDGEPLLEVVPEVDEEPLEGAVAVLGEEPLLEVVPEVDEEPLEGAVAVLGEEPLLEIEPEADEEPLEDVVLGEEPLAAAAPDADPDADVATVAGVTPTPCAVLLALLPLHAASTSDAAPPVSAATQCPSDKFRFISGGPTFRCARELCSQRLVGRSLSLGGDCLRSATISAAE